MGCAKHRSEKKTLRTDPFDMFYLPFYQEKVTQSVV